MRVHLRDVIGYLDTTLEIGRFKDYAPNGLQGAMRLADELRTKFPALDVQFIGVPSPL